MMKLSVLFKKCMDAHYIAVGDCEYGWEREGRRLFLFLQWRDEKRNRPKFGFPKKCGGAGAEWYCRRGYARAWESVKPYVREIIEKCDGAADEIVVVGYSHGAGLATVAFDRIWQNYPLLRGRLVGYGFGSPRVYFGLMNKDAKARWRNFHPVLCGADIVTRTPFFPGYRHVSRPLKVGGGTGPFKSHYPGSYIIALDKSGLKVELLK